MNACPIGNNDVRWPTSTPFLLSSCSKYHSQVFHKYISDKTGSGYEATEKACSNPKRPEKNTVATLHSLPSQIQSVLDCCKTLTYPVPGTVWHITPDRYPRRGYGIMSRACETITKTRKRLGRPTPTKRDPRTSVTAHDH